MLRLARCDSPYNVGEPDGFSHNVAGKRLHVPPGASRWPIPSGRRKLAERLGRLLEAFSRRARVGIRLLPFVHAARCAVRASLIRSSPVRIRSLEVAKLNRRCESHWSPKATPGVTATP